MVKFILCSKEIKYLDQLLKPPSGGFFNAFIFNNIINNVD